MTALRIFIGWDSREEIAYDVCRQSLEAHSSIQLDIIPIKQDELRRRGLYTPRSMHCHQRSLASPAS